MINCLLKPVGLALCMTLLLSACTHTPPSRKTDPSATQKGVKRGGGYYKDDGPGSEIPDNLDNVPDAVPRIEPLHRAANKPYVVFGKTYVPDTRLKTFRQRGIASWYGKKFHGKKTSIGEPYDMFSMTAAHPTLAIPSYVRVTNTGNGKTAIVRVIDRGPFHADRIIDLSYAAAYRLGYINAGSTSVEIESILPDSANPLTYSTSRPVVTAKAPVQRSAPISAIPPAGVENENSELLLSLPTELSESDAVETLIAQAVIAETGVNERESKGSDVPSPAAVPTALFLQLGAFSNADNADNLRIRLSQELDWLSEEIRVVAGDGIHRIQLGPYSSREAAEKAAEKIKEKVGYSPSFVKKTP